MMSETKIVPISVAELDLLEEQARTSVNFLIQQCELVPDEFITDEWVKFCDTNNNKPTWKQYVDNIVKLQTPSVGLDSDIYIQPQLYMVLLYTWMLKIYCDKKQPTSIMLEVDDINEENINARIIIERLNTPTWKQLSDTVRHLSRFLAERVILEADNKIDGEWVLFYHTALQQVKVFDKTREMTWKDVYTNLNEWLVDIIQELGKKNIDDLDDLITVGWKSKYEALLHAWKIDLANKKESGLEENNSIYELNLGFV